MSARTLLHRFTRYRRLGIGLGIFAGLIILFGLLGYFWLPGYARTKLETVLSEALHRPVTVESIEIQPYTLELTVRGFRVGEKETSPDAGKDLFSFDELYANVSVASIARRGPVVSAVSLKGPTVRLVREAEQRFNITDLIEDFMKRPSDGGAKSMFSVQNIVIEGGHVEFVDKVKKSHQEISDIRIGVPFIANFESAEETWVEPKFSARVNGAPFNLNGKLRPFTKNREATLEIKLSDVDLTRINEYSPIPLDIRLLSGYFDSELLLTFTHVDGQSPTIVLTGSAALKKLEVENRSVEAPYAVRLGELNAQLIEINLNAVKPSHAAVTLTEVAVVREGNTEPALSLQKFSLDEILVDSRQKTITLGAAAMDRFTASLRRDPDGRLDLAKLFTPLTDSTELTPELSKAETSKPWGAKLESLKLADAALRFEDATLPDDVPPLGVKMLDLAISNIDFSGAAPAKFELKAEINENGSLETSGSFAWAPMAVDFAVDAKDVDLVALQGWAGDRLNVLFSRGALSFRGNIKAEGRNGQKAPEGVQGEETPGGMEAPALKVVASGDGRLTNFNVLDKVDATRLMRWRSVDIKGIEFANEPLSINATSIAIADFFAHVVITPKGELNLKYIVRQEETSASPAQAAAVPAGVAEPPPEPISAPAEPLHTTQTTPAPSRPQARKSLPIRVGSVALQGGRVNFHDQFIKPNYRANLTGLAGRVGPLHPKKAGQIDIRGAVDKTAPLKIVGKIDTFGNELYLDVTASAKGIDMPTFSPYSGKYIGYAIEKGKLSVDVHYHVEHGELTAENNVFLDQLTFGEKIESPDALSIPVNLALALLKNRRGEIDVHLPISGSINDPKFSLGGIIVDAILNLLTKAATAPFALLESLFGGEELSEINFAPGEARILPEAEERLQKLAQALTDRPALDLEITGRADPSIDPEPLKRHILERKIKTEKRSEDIKKGKVYDSLDDITLAPEEYEKYLTRVYKEAKFAKPKNVIGFTKSLPVPEMEKLMLANISAGKPEMQDLADRRARSARDWLIERGGIPGTRVFMLSPKVEVETNREKPGNLVEFSLR